MGLFTKRRITCSPGAFRFYSVTPGFDMKKELIKRRYSKIGSLIRDGLVRTISSPILTGVGYDGDVEGVDVEPTDKDKDKDKDK